MSDSRKMLLRATMSLCIAVGGLFVTAPRSAEAAQRSCPENFCVFQCANEGQCDGCPFPFECIEVTLSCEPFYGLATCARAS
jgi:hypothetical protein